MEAIQQSEVEEKKEKDEMSAVLNADNRLVPDFKKHERPIKIRCIYHFSYFPCFTYQHVFLLICRNDYAT